MRVLFGVIVFIALCLLLKAIFRLLAYLMWRSVQTQTGQAQTGGH